MHVCSAGEGACNSIRSERNCLRVFEVGTRALEMTQVVQRPPVGDNEVIKERFAAIDIAGSWTSEGVGIVRAAKVARPCPVVAISIVNCEMRRCF